MMRHTGPLHLHQEDLASATHDSNEKDGAEKQTKSNELNEQDVAPSGTEINAMKVLVGTGAENTSDEKEISQGNQSVVPSVNDCREQRKCHLQ